MGDHNSMRLLQKLVPKVDGTVLEIGSLDNGDGKATSLREFYSENKYYGIDIRKGNNVDVAWDICLNSGCYQPTTLYGFDITNVELVYAISVFEHLAKPWIASQNIQTILKGGGLLFIAVPWVWRYHPYPDDYFRYSFSGIKSLFPDIEWIYQGTCGQDGKHTEYKIGQHINDNPNIVVTNKQKYLPYTMINMLGRQL